MWTLRRASNPLRNCGFSRRTSLGCTNSELLGSYREDTAILHDYPRVVFDISLSFDKFYHTTISLSKSFVGRNSLSSQAGAGSNLEEDDFEDGFSELDTPMTVDAVEVSNEEDGKDDEFISKPQLSDHHDEEGPSQNELEFSDTETDSSDKRSSKKRVSLELFKAIVDAPGLSISNALDKWVKEGKALDPEEISSTIFILRKRRMYGRALQLLEWLEANKRLDINVSNYISRLDLIAKVHGLQKAENYIGKIPKSFRSELIYRTLLANCVKMRNVKKAEEVFNKMKDLDFPTTIFTSNQLLILYKKFDKKKIAEVLLLMERENVKPNLFTYKILIDTKGQSNDITGMDQIVETMKAEGIEPDLNTKSILAKHYTFAGLKEKAEAVLKEMEEDVELEENQSAIGLSLPLYAALGKADEVERLWNICESNPQLDVCMSAIDAWGRLNKIEAAEGVFDLMAKTWRLSTRQYYALLRVYANHKMLAKGKNLVKQMVNSGCRLGPLIWDLLVKLYVEAGEVEKVDSILQKAAQQNQMKPLFNSYRIIMDEYAKRGDVHNAEKMFHRMRQAGYMSQIRPFQALVQAYVNAKVPAYGIRERMKADKIFPNNALAGQLARVDAFRKTAVSDFLE